MQAYHAPRASVPPCMRPPTASCPPVHPCLPLQTVEHVKRQRNKAPTRTLLEAEPTPTEPLKMGTLTKLGEQRRGARHVRAHWTLVHHDAPLLRCAFAACTCPHLTCRRRRQELEEALLCRAEQGGQLRHPLLRGRGGVRQGRQAQGRHQPVLVQGEALHDGGGPQGQRRVQRQAVPLVGVRPPPHVVHPRRRRGDPQVVDPGEWWSC